MKLDNKEYLGDSVYVGFYEYYLTLTTENGGEPGNIILLEPSVVDNLMSYIARYQYQSARNHTPPAPEPIRENLTPSD